MEPPVFVGGWSYSQKEINELFKHIVYAENYSILEFGSGDSTIKLYNHFKQSVANLTFITYESDPSFIQTHDTIQYVKYNENDIPDLLITDKVFDLILIDGPTGDKRSLWYSKIRNNVKPGTIILIDDFNHYKCFSDELDKTFEYEMLSFSDEPPLPGNKSWKIVRIIAAK